MKKLYLMRHAKALRDGTALGDHELPLNPRGRSACILVSNYIRAHHIQPDLVLYSSAVRSRETVTNLLSALGKDTKIEEMRKLYLASAGEIFRIINETNNAVNSLMVIAHNPGMHQICMMLQRGGNKDKLYNMMINMPTASVATFTLDIDSWDKAGPETAILEDFITPAELSI